MPNVLLTGRVVDARGQAVPAAELFVVESTDPAMVLARASTDGLGDFRIGAVPLRSSWDVIARGDGWSASRVVVTSAGDPVLLRLQPALRLFGTLRRDDGSPAAGVVVRGISFAMRPPVDEFATTDEHGRWRLSHLMPGPISLVAAVPGEGMHRRNGFLVEHGEVQLTRAGTSSTSLKVQLHGMPPAAAGKVFVELAPDGGYPGLPPPWHHSALGDDGYVELSELPPVAYTVRLLGTELSIAEAEQRIEPTALPRTLTFHLREPDETMRELVVQLDDPGGSPLPGVALRMLPEPTAPASTLPGSAVTDARGVARFVCRVPVGQSCAIVSASREFVVHAAAKDQVEVSGPVRKSHRFLAAVDCRLDVVASAAARVSGRVVGVDGEPILSAEVVLAPLEIDPTRETPLARAITGINGRYEIVWRKDSRQRLAVSVCAGDASVSSRPFAFVGEQDSIELADLRRPETGRLRAFVVLVDGSRQPGVHVTVASSSGNGPPPVAISDANGEVLFEDLPLGPVRLQAYPSGVRGISFGAAGEVLAHETAELSILVRR